MTRRFTTFTLLLLAALLAGAPRARADQAGVEAYNRAVIQYNNRVDRHERAATEFNKERAAFMSAARHYNSLPAEQRTDFQYNRLQRWYDYLQQRLPQLDREWDSLQRRSAELDAWLARLGG